MVGSDIADFGPLLKHWRKVRGKTQLALSHIAGVSAKHIAFLEVARARPSRDMVLTLVQSLDIPPRERNVLLRAAGFADFYAETPLTAENLGPVREALRFILARHEPYPAMVVDSGWNLQLTNRAARAVFAAFTSKGPAPAVPNAMRLVFDPRGIRPAIENWEQIAGHLLRRLHREAIEAGSGAPVRKLLDELLALPGVADLLKGRPDVDSGLPVIPMVLRRGRERLALFSLVSSFGTAIDLTLYDLRVETLMPVDDATGRRLERFV